MNSPAELDAVEELTELLRLAGAVPTLDSGRNSTHPCTFCGTPPPKGRGLSFDLVTIGRYPTGSALTRPVCPSCKPTADIFEKMLEQQSATAHAKPLPPLSSAARGVLTESTWEHSRRARTLARAARVSYSTSPFQAALQALADAHDEAAEVYEALSERVRSAK